MARKILSVPPICTVLRAANGNISHAIARDGASPLIEIWWDRSAGHKEELLFIRQETDGAPHADVVTLTLAQLYAAIDALNRSVVTR